MTTEDKDILIKDLSSRLPYGVKVNNEIQGDFTIYGICENFVYGRSESCHIDFAVEKIKPYLYPISSMTKAQKKEYAHLLTYTSNVDIIQITGESTYDWLNKNMFDWRGLIPKGLAKDATGLKLY